MKEFLPIGRIINTHGIRGEVKLDMWCDGEGSIKKVTEVFTGADGSGALRIVSRRMHGRFMLLTLEGVDSLDDALKYKGKELFARRGDISKGEKAYFIADLIGLAVYDGEGEKIGEVTDVFNRGASDILEISREGKSSALVPMVKDFVKSIDLEKGIVIFPAEGLLEP